MRVEDIRTLQFEPTSYCNAKCPHCGRFDKQGNLHPDLTLSHLDADVILNNLELSKLSSLSEIILEGDKGDPIMHPEIEKFIERFYELPGQPIIHLMTNGGIRSTAWWSALGKKYPRLKLTFSIDGLQDTNHLYRVGVNYRKAVDNAQAYIDAGGYAIWKFLIFSHNEHQVAEVKQLSKEMNFSALNLKSADRNRFDGEKQWPVQINGTLSHYIAPPSLSIADQEYIVYKKYNFDFKDQPLTITNRICPNTSRGQIYINHQGYVVPCCMMHFDTENNYFGKDRIIELTEGLEHQSLVINTLSQVLENKFFNNNLVDSLLGPVEQWHFNCERSCRDTILENKSRL
jgi:MoaA/NifB/PqqE/SkfB family radical SAM enzyme